MEAFPKLCLAAGQDMVEVDFHISYLSRFCISCISHQSGRAFCYEATLCGDLHGSAGRVPNLGEYCLNSRCM